MQTVSDVLESQGRSALLPDAIITTILAQLIVTVNYEPMLCQIVIRNLMADMANEMKAQNCIAAGNTVTAICTVMMGQGMKIVHSTRSNNRENTAQTTNIIMANWTRMMWQSVLSRAIRILASRPFGSHFFSAVVTVDGN
ncbi:hypothetical protein KIN20_010067 [Parelaphostrongylus tenuis]|uniref:Uncharacterized protein n=1 Tax=Parelaphostrongylus tenuis TaxID=148309 RepID=A0AAD5MAS5_PARTN|nr:hypothetical protein KIN20_010067 [Parelaphostrongylus tenuis]